MRQMAEQNKTPQQLIDEVIAKGGILAVMYFDISSNQKDLVQGALADLIARITKEQGIISVVGEIEDPIEIEGIWSTSAEVTMLSKNFASLSIVAMRFGPLGVEVIRPDQVKLSLGEAQGTLLNIAQVGQDFSQFILETVMNEQQKADFKKRIAARAEQGKKLLEKMEKKG